MKSGTVSDGDAKLVIQARHEREIDTLSAWPLLQTRLSDTEIASCVSISPSKLDDLVAAKAPKRGGAKAKRELAKELDELGAIKYRETQSLTERRET